MPKKLNLKAHDIDPSIKPLFDQLKGMLGVLSDIDVHFTPEFLSRLSWDKRNESMYLNYFIKEQLELERAIVLTSATHLTILKVIDWCFDGGFESNSDWHTLLGRVANEGSRWQSRIEGVAAGHTPLDV